MTEQHTTSARHLRFGTCGWRQSAWLTTYYPDDLPEDWQLSYYANELPAVLLEASAWVTASAQALAGWAEDVHPDFRFYLMADPVRELARQQQLAASLGECLGGLLWPESPAPDGCLAPLAELPPRMQGWGDAQGLRVAVLDVVGLDLRARRGLLEQLAPYLSAALDQAVIVRDADSAPPAVRELQTVADLMGLA
jgi:hypothetical protein